MSNCLGLGLDAFYGADENKSMTPTELRNARNVCHYCLARKDCLAEALRTDERFGIWGGFTGPERARIVTMYTPRKPGKSDGNLTITRALTAMSDGGLEAKVVML
jgi:hypothetical protein